MYGFRSEPMVIKATYTENYIEKIYSDGRVVRTTGKGKNTESKILTTLTPGEIDTLEEEMTNNFKREHNLLDNVKSD